MPMEFGNDLKEATARLDALEAERLDVQNRLGEAVEDGDADLIIRLERRARQIDVEQFAARARALKLRRADVERQRGEAIALRDALEVALAEATKHYAEAVTVADERRVVMQTAQVQTFSCQSRIDQLREDFNELNDELKHLVNSRVGGNR